MDRRTASSYAEEDEGVVHRRDQGLFGVAR
jgi:hypothetical protein